MSLLATLRELECELHDPKCRRDRACLERLLVPDFREFGRSGSAYVRDDYVRDDRLANLSAAASSETKIHAQDFAVHPLSDAIALLTYRSANVTPSGELTRHTNRASIWRRGSSGWQMVFHQGTPTEHFDYSTT
jgi:hypothetical protein